MSENFKLRLRLERRWVRATVSAGDDVVEIDASYISDAVGNLMRSAVALLRSPGIPRDCRWLVEPGEYRWLLATTADGISVRIVTFNQFTRSAPVNRGEVLFDTVTSPVRFATELAGQLKQLHNEHGTDGYRELWNHDFPADELQALVREIDLLKAGASP